MYELVCLGNPLLDLQVNSSPEFLEKYDLKADDAILAEPKHLSIYEEVLQDSSLVLVAGGAAQNTARGAQYILPANSVVYFGCVGDDIYAQKLQEANDKYGLTTKYMVSKEHETGKCAALITGHHRSLVTDLAAANHFKPDHLDIAENWAIVENAKVFYIGGFHLTVSPEAIVKLGKHASDHNKPFIINFSAPFIPQFYKLALDQVLPYADYIIANESEAEAFAESYNLSDKDIVSIAKYVVKLPKTNKSPRTVIFTQGTKETIAVSETNGEFVVQKIPVHILEESKLVDSNGAGDAFAAGFVASIVQNKPLLEAIDIGQWAAKLSLQQVGPSFPFPKQSYTN